MAVLGQFRVIHVLYTILYSMVLFDVLFYVMTLAFPNHVLDVTPLDQTNILDFDKVTSTLGTLGTSAAAS